MSLYAKDRKTTNKYLESTIGVSKLVNHKNHFFSLKKTRLMSELYNHTAGKDIKHKQAEHQKQPEPTELVNQIILNTIFNISWRPKL